MTITREIKEKIERVEALVLGGTAKDYTAYRELIARRNELLDLQDYLKSNKDDDEGDEVDKT